MSIIKKAFIMPHPPIIIPEIGRGGEAAAAKTIEGCKKAASALAEEAPETIIVITPHGPIFRDAVCIGADSVLQGDFGGFGRKSISFEFENDRELCESIGSELEIREVNPVMNNQISQKSYGLNSGIDHGVLVPLYYVKKEYKKFRIVHITFGMLSPEKLYKCGMAIKQAVAKTERKVVVIASADLSHRLTADAPAGYNPDGQRYDDFVVECIKDRKFAKFLNADIKLRENAGECGHRSINIMLGIFEGQSCKTELYSYEGPFGVGYMNACISADGAGPGVLTQYRNLKNKINVESRKKESKYVRLARETIEMYVRDGEIPESFKATNDKKGTFVSIKKNGILRGCIGTIEATQNCIENEIIDNAVKAATQDPRFPPMGEDELDELVISVDILSVAEVIKKKSELDVKKYGVIVTSGNRRGLLLPNLDGVDTIDEQLHIVLQKAGINESEDYVLERFKVERYI